MTAREIPAYPATDDAGKALNAAAKSKGEPGSLGFVALLSMYKVPPSFFSACILDAPLARPTRAAVSTASNETAARSVTA